MSVRTEEPVGLALRLEASGSAAALAVGSGWLGEGLGEAGGVQDKTSSPTELFW